MNPSGLDIWEITRFPDFGKHALQTPVAKVQEVLWKEGKKAKG